MINVGKTITKAALRDLTDDSLFELVEQVGDLAHIRYSVVGTTVLDAVVTEPKRDKDNNIIKGEYKTTVKKGKGGLKIKERVDKWVVVT